jgi:hypothetical protein
VRICDTRRESGLIGGLQSSKGNRDDVAPWESVSDDFWRPPRGRERAPLSCRCPCYVSEGGKLGAGFLFDEAAIDVVSIMLYNTCLQYIQNAMVNVM